MKKGKLIRKEIIAIIILFILVAGLSYVYQNYFKINDAEIKEVCINERCFDVEIVDSDEKRQRGLMFRKSLEDDSGMLFIFDKEEIYPFWMKNTLIALDIIWIDSDLEVVYIAKAVPCITEECESYIPAEKAKYVLEVNSGVSEERNIGIGDRVRFK